MSHRNIYESWNKKMFNLFQFFTSNYLLVGASHLVCSCHIFFSWLLSKQRTMTQKGKGAIWKQQWVIKWRKIQMRNCSILKGRKDPNNEKNEKYYIIINRLSNQKRIIPFFIYSRIDQNSRLHHRTLKMNTDPESLTNFG